MKFYYAGYTAWTPIIELVPTVLESYLTFGRNPERLISDIQKYKIKDFFLDSGAFTAFTKGTKIDIDEYIAFCHVVKKYVKVIANLDVIGDPEKTYKNWIYMKSKGINALPVIHYGADKKYFDIYFKEYKEPYVAFGGLVPYAKFRTKLEPWLDYCYWTIKDFFPVKIHLFGLMSPWVLKRYPSYSCDSTSWLRGCRFGSLLEYHNLGFKKKENTLFYLRKRDYKYLSKVNVLQYMRLNIKINELWKMRGITWKD